MLGYHSKIDFKKSLPQICVVGIISCLMVAFGLIRGFPTILIPHLSKRSSDDDIRLDDEELSWLGSISTICFPVGNLISGILVTLLGRKEAMQLACIPLFVCCIGLKYSIEVWQVLLGLAVNGFASGFLEPPIITYIAEIAVPNLRGVLIAILVVALTVGMIIVYALGAVYSWRNVAFVISIFPFISLFLLFIIPESPNWLVQKGKFDDAKNSLAWLRGWTCVSSIEQEFQDLLHQKNENTKIVLGYKDILYNYTRRSFIVPLALSCFMFLIGDFNGSVSLQTYAVEIFATLQVPINEYGATIILGCANLLGTLLCIVLINHLGKRVLTFFSLILGSLCTIAVATFAHTKGIYYLSGKTNQVLNESANYQWLPLTLLVISAFASQFGIGTITWIIVSEVFSTATSHIGSGVCAAVHYILSTIATKVFFSTVSHFTLPGTLWFYGAVGIFGPIALYFWLPETEGKPLQEISDHFSGISKLDNKVGRKPIEINETVSN